MKILFFTHYFPPEVNAPANRTHEHCRAWAAAGHDVHVITGIPSHPRGVPFPGYRRRWYQHELVDGIHVHRVWTYLAPNRGVLFRVLNFLSFIPTSVFRALRLGTFDAAIGTSPQFFCAVATWLYTRLRRVPMVFELRDLWPESIPAVGAMKKSFVLRLLERLELKMYHDSKAIVCLTRSFMSNLVGRGVAESKLHYVPNGIVPSFWQSASRSGARESFDIGPDNVVVSYVGTIGMAHGLSTLLEAAPLIAAAAPEVALLIVGEGAELPALKQLAHEKGLTNLRFTGMIPRQDVPGILAASDIALVTLKPSDVFKTVLPSKMFEAMAAGRPIILAVDGEARRTLERGGAGLAVTPGDARSLAEAVIALARDESARARMGLSGARFVEAEFSREKWAATYLDVLAGLVKPFPSALAHA